MKYTEEYLGKLELLGSPVVTAALPVTVVLRYTVGKYAIDENAGFKLAWRSVSDWELPQFQDPLAYGYTTVITTGDCRIEYAVSSHERPFHNCILVKARDGALKEGDTVTVTMGDTSMGSAGIRAQSFAERAHEFKLFVDSLNINHYVELPESVFVEVVSGPANEIQAVVPSLVTVGEPFDIKLRMLDEWGNPCTDFEGTVSLGWERAEGEEASCQSAEGVRSPEIPARVTMTARDNGVLTVPNCLIHAEGTYYFQAGCEEISLFCSSNPCRCRDDRPYRLFWGDMHGQTALTVGTGSLDDYYSFGRGPGALDFTGWQGNDFEITEEKWEEVKAKSREYQEDGKFLTFLGYEWSGNHPGGGDHNVFYLGDDETFYPSSHWEVRSLYDEEHSRDRYPVDKLFDEFRGRKDVMIVPHIGGRPANLDYYDEEFIDNIEIHSHHGTFEWFAHEAMARRLKVGFVATSDDHTCRPGLSYALQNTGQAANAFDVKSGLTGVYARELTKEAIWEALRSRRCFAATFNRMILEVTIGDAMMGQEITVRSAPTIRVRAEGSDPIDHIDIYRGNDLIHTCYNYVKAPSPSIKRIRLLWSGVRTRGRKKSTKWDGNICISKGKICHVEEVAFDTFQQGITYRSNQTVGFRSSTSGDLDGLILDVDAPDDAVITFSSKVKAFQLQLGELGERPVVFEAGGVNLKVECSIQGTYDESRPYAACRCECSVTDSETACDFRAYWVKAVQNNGQMAFSSPIFVNWV